MMRTEKMAKLNIVAPRAFLKKVIETLYSEEIIHLVDFRKSEKEFFDLGQPFEEATGFSEQLVKLRGLISALGLEGKTREMKNNLSESEKHFKGIREKVEGIREEQARVSEALAGVNENLCNPMLGLEVPEEWLSFQNLEAITGAVQQNPRQLLEKKISDFELVARERANGYAIALFVKKREAEKARQALSGIGFSEQAPIEENESELREERARLEARQKLLEKHFIALKKNSEQFLLAYEAQLAELVEKAEAPLRFGSSSSSFVASGWIPARKSNSVKRLLEQVTKGKIIVEIEETGEGAPIKLANPRIVQPFQFLLDLYALPKYTEVDPTFLTFITFPLFFGFMLGDVGYGIVTGIAFFIARQKMKGQMKSLSTMLLMASFSTIIFGFVYGEFFGVEFIHHPLLNRVHDINTMLLISVLVGVIHINLGFAVGFVNERVSHGLKHALFAKASWIVIEIGIALLALDSLGVAAIGALPGAIVALAGVAMLYKGEGVQGIIELPALLSNALSYARLYAIGLASVALALIINEMAGEMFAAGGAFIALGIVVLFLGHFINILLGILGPFLQSLRLHYVEFFTKFYHGGGVAYAPFGSNKRR